MDKRIFIHAVWNHNGTFVCHAPSCQFSGTLSQAAWHVIENQFKVEVTKSSPAHAPKTR